MKKQSLFSILSNEYHANKNIVELEPEEIRGINFFIDSEINNAGPITFDELAGINPKEDGGSFVIDIRNDIRIKPCKLDFHGIKTTITIRGTGNADKHSEMERVLLDSHESIFNNNKGKIIIGKGTVLILDEIQIVSENYTGCVIEINGGILVLKNARIINGYHDKNKGELEYEGHFTTNYNFCGVVFHTVESINRDPIMDIFNGNGEGFIYIYEIPPTES